MDPALHAQALETLKRSVAFRTVAGLFFALLFLLRGFGIAAGTHFFYDLLVGLV